MSFRYAALSLALLALPATAQTTYTVTTTDDDGAGSLRQAIVDANANDGPDVIAFAIDGGGAYAEVFLQTALPFITGPITMDGSTQGCDTAGGPCVRLDGAAIPEPDDRSGSGVVLLGGDSVIHGLLFTRFGRFEEDRDSGLLLASSNNRVTGCTFGTDRAGMITDPDGMPDSGDELGNGFGLSLVDFPDGPPTAGNVIGGFEPGERNVIAGSLESGVSISGLRTTGNQVIGNYVGTNAAGTASLGNVANGVLLGDSTGFNLVGGNVLSGNASAGIRVQGGASDNAIATNLIGTDATGSFAVPNGTLAGLAQFMGNGIEITGGRRNAVEGNTVSGNLLGGIIIGFVNVGGLPGPFVAADNVVRGNLIGLADDGETAIPNGVPDVAGVGFGIVLVSGQNTSTTGNLIGGSSPLEANVIGFNTTAGIGAQGSTVIGNVISGNLIGITVSEDPAPNGQVGILFRTATALGQTTGPTGNRIGDDDPDFEDDLVGNGIAFQTFGVVLTGGTAGNDVAFNTFAGTAFPVDLAAGAEPDGPTPNDPGDADDGPNRLQNAPVVLEAPFDADADEITVRYRVDTAAENATYPLTVRFYGQVEDDGLELLIPLGSATYAAPGQATTTFDNVLNDRSRVFATATDADGNTSEVSLDGVAVAAGDAPELDAEVRVGPNPTAGPVRFAFTLAAPADVTVTLFDMLGRSVAEVRQSGALGAQELALDAALPAGVYLWRLRAGDRVETGQVTVVR